MDQIRKSRGLGFLEAVSFDHETANECPDLVLRLKQAMTACGDIIQAGFEILGTLEQQMINVTVTQTNATTVS